MSPQRYRLVVKGELGPRYASAFGEMTVSAHDGLTDITGDIVDSAHLHGLLARMNGLGLTLHSVTPIETETPCGSRASDASSPDRDEAPHESRGHGAGRS